MFDKAFAISPGYSDGSCNSTHFQCIVAKEAVLFEEFNLTSPYDCCKTCLMTNGCKSWMHFYEDLQFNVQYQIGEKDTARCRLYSKPLDWKGFELHSGNCVLGEPYTGEPRPNFVLYYPDTVRAEYLCSPSRFVVFPITMCYALFLYAPTHLL
eukprot:883351_1